MNDTRHALHSAQIELRPKQRNIWLVRAVHIPTGRIILIFRAVSDYHRAIRSARAEVAKIDRLRRNWNLTTDAVDSMCILSPV